MRRVVWLTLVITATSSPLFAGNGTGAVRDGAVSTGRTEIRSSPPRSSRLKFRSGPVCTCSGGLDEAQISAAERARAGKADTVLQNIIGEQ